MSAPLFAHSAIELAAKVRSGELTATELVEHALQRIAAHDGELGAFVELCAARARKEAAAIDRRRQAGVALPPFAGVPIGIKDLHRVAGMHLRMGSRAYRHLRVPFDDAAVTALRRAGFIVVGKTATSEFGILPICETAIHPPTRNPYSPAHTAGGSSGGSGAAVAAGLVPIALGGDGGGSIRIPSALGGLVGYKASRGRIPSPFEPFDKLAISTIGALAADVDDAFACSLVLRGDNPYRALPAPRPRLRVQYAIEPPFGAVDPSIAAAVLAVAERLRALGHTVEEGPPIKGELSEFMPVWKKAATYTPVIFSRYTEPLTQWLRKAGKQVTWDEARAALGHLQARVDAWFGEADLCLLPTIAGPPPRVGQFAAAGPEEKFLGTAPLGYFTAVFNASGNPAVSLPLGVQPQGVPIGVQLVGRRGEDEALLATARSLELRRLFPNRYFAGPIDRATR